MDDAAGGEGEEDQNWVACDCCLKWRTAAYSFDATRCFSCATAQERIHTGRSLEP